MLPMSIISRLVGSVLLLMLAVFLSSTQIANPDYALKPVQFQAKLAMLYAPPMTPKSSFLCAACGFPHTAPTFNLICTAILTHMGVMTTLIYGVKLFS